MKKFRTHHKIFIIILGLIGVVNIWRGLWGLFDLTPFLSNPLISLTIGLVLVALAGGFYKLF